MRSTHKPRPARNPATATLEQLTALTAALPEQYRAMAQLAAWCGMRYGEVAALRRMDLAADGSEISVTSNSGAGARKITVPGFLAEQLVDHLARWTAPEADALLFPGPCGDLLALTSFLHHYYPARAAAGRPDLHFYDLRHSGATWAAEMGARASK